MAPTAHNAAGLQSLGPQGIYSGCDMSTDRKTFKMRDGTILSYMESGRGRTLVLVHGWSQMAEQFHLQFDAFAERYHVIAFDQRGHGLSSRPNHGYRVSRLTMDLRELLTSSQFC